MGLLDALNSRDGIFALGLLDAAAPKPVRTSLGGGLLQALGQAQAWQQNRDDREAAAEERRQRAAMQAMQQQLMQAQIGETQAQAQQRQAAVEAAKRQAAEQQRIKGLLQGALAPVAPIQANATSGIAGPRPEALNVVGSRPAVDWQQLIAQGVPAELVAKLAEAPNLGRAKAVRTVEVMGPNGPETVQLDEFGNRVGQGLAKPVELKMQDLGGKVAALNPYTGAAAGPGLAKTMTPGEVASNSLGWANNAVSRERLRWDQQQADKPVWDAERGIVVDPRGGTARPVTIGGQPVGPKDKGLNETQAKALLFGSRMQESDRTLSTLAAAGVDRPGGIKSAAETTGRVLGLGTESLGGTLSDVLGTATNWTQSKEQQQIEQAQRDFINAVLRRESGAAISPQEFDSARRQYFPALGDSETVKAQKARNRALATQMMLAEVPDAKRPQTRPGAPLGMPSAEDIDAEIRRRQMGGR